MGDGGRPGKLLPPPGELEGAPPPPRTADTGTFTGAELRGVAELELGVLEETALAAAVGTDTGADAGCCCCCCCCGGGCVLGGGGRMNGWWKNTSNSRRSRAFLFSRPVRRSASSRDVPAGILEQVGTLTRFVIIVQVDRHLLHRASKRSVSQLKRRREKDYFQTAERVREREREQAKDYTLIIHTYIDKTWQPCLLMLLAAATLAIVSRPDDVTFI